MPEVHGRFVVVSAEGKVADHLEVGQMGAVTDKFEVVGTDTRLERTKPSAVWMTEAMFERLHAAANEQGGVVALGYDTAVWDQSDAKLLEPPFDDF